MNIDWISADCGEDDHPPIPHSTCCAWCDPPESWVDRARCRNIENADSLFFGGSRYKEARAICSRCDVRPYCLERGWDEEYGIWAGLSEEQRDKLRRALGLERVSRRQRRLTIRTIGAKPLTV